MQNYPNGPQQPYPNQQQPGGYPSNPGYPPQGQPGPYPQQPGYPPPGYQQPPMQPQQPVKKKFPIFKVGCGSIVAIIVLAIIIGVANGGKSNTGTAVTTSGSSTTNSTNSQPAQHFKVGDTVKVGSNWQAVVNSAKTDSGGQYSALKSGDVYLVADITVTNESSQEQTVSSIVDFTMQDSTGQKYDESIDSNAGATLDGKVAAGSPLKGVIVWEVPSSQKSFLLHFSPDIVASGQTTWDLSV